MTIRSSQRCVFRLLFPWVPFQNNQLTLALGQVSNLIDVIEDGPESAEILSSFEGA
jgi:hypothetical protein